MVDPTIITKDQISNCEDVSDPNVQVVYDHMNGTPYLLNTRTGAIVRALVKKDEYGLPHDDTRLLKDSRGRYRPEVKMACKKLYFDWLSVGEIAERTGVPKHAVSRWVYGDDQNSSEWGCWNNERKRGIQEQREKSSELYIKVERSALAKIYEFMANPENDLKNARQFKDFAEGLAKLLSLPDGPNRDANRSSHNSTSGPGKTQININTQVVQPLTPDEARKILVEDPIRVAEGEVVSEENYRHTNLNNVNKYNFNSGGGAAA